MKNNEKIAVTLKATAFASSKHLALTAVMSATLVAGKFALSFIPNVEIVTTLILVYAFCFKWDAVAAAFIFCTLDVFIYPPALDVIISYYIYWNLLAIGAALMRALNIKSFNAYLVYSLIMTVFFGVLTALVSHIVVGVPFIPYYAAGLVFYAAQLVSTLCFMLAGFKPLSRLLTRLNFALLRSPAAKAPEAQVSAEKRNTAKYTSAALSDEETAEAYDSRTPEAQVSAAEKPDGSAKG